MGRDVQGRTGTCRSPTMPLANSTETSLSSFWNLWRAIHITFWGAPALREGRRKETGSDSKRNPSHRNAMTPAPTGTLDDALGLGEDGLGALKVLDAVPDLVARVVAVDRSDLGLGSPLLEGGLETLDSAEIGLKTRADDEVIVRELFARLERQRVGRRVEGGGVRGVEGEVVREEGGDRSTEALLLGEASADERPAGLVVVVLRTVDEGNVALAEGDTVPGEAVVLRAVEQAHGRQHESEK